jgi:hypothetical protein
VAAPNAPNVAVKGALTVGHWEAPHKGVLRDFPPYKLAPDSLYDCLNVVFRNGELQPRPGMVQLSPTDLGARVTGATQESTLASGAFEPTAFENTAFLTTANADGTIVVAGTNKKFWAYFGGTWHDITNSPLTATDTYLAQFTTIQIGSTVFVLLTNGIDAPRSWDNVSATCATIAGTPPLFTDWTTASDRVIGVVPPYLIQWGNALNISTWPALNFRVLSDTTDTLVAIENLGTLGVAVYKRRSIWIGTAQGGLDSSFFSFQLRGQFEGPANPNSLVNVNGAHYYQTKTGRIGVFDGVTHTWINDGILPLISGVIDINNMQRAFGVYDPIQREVWFYFPTLADNTSTTGNISGVCVVTLPHPFSYEGVFFHSCYLGKTAIPVTAGTDRRLDVGDRIIFGQNSGKNLAYLQQSGISDDGVSFTGFFQTPPQMTKDGDIAQAIGVETYGMYGGGQGPLTLRLGASPMLGNLTTTGFSTGVVLDLTVEPTLAPDLGAFSSLDQFRGRFFSCRYEFASPVTFHYYGSRLMGTKVQ